MRCLYLLVLAAVGCLAGDYEVEDGVLVLTKDTFDAATAEHEHILVEFCKSLSICIP